MSVTSLVSSTAPNERSRVSLSPRLRYHSIAFQLPLPASVFGEISRAETRPSVCRYELNQEDLQEWMLLGVSGRDSIRAQACAFSSTKPCPFPTLSSPRRGNAVRCREISGQRRLR